jgi:N-acetylglutamate synthase-like GNAT family acetyltransferase
MEALAINPAAKETEIAAGLNAAMQLIVSQCHIRGIGEVYFLCADESTKKFAEHHGFEKVPFDLYRLKIGDLEKS